MFSKSKKLTPEQIQEQLKDYTELLEVYSTVFIACKSEVLRDFSINGNNLKKGTNGLVLAYESRWMCVLVKTALNPYKIRENQLYIGW